VLSRPLDGENGENLDDILTHAGKRNESEKEERYYDKADETNQTTGSYDEV